MCRELAEGGHGLTSAQIKANQIFPAFKTDLNSLPEVCRFKVWASEGLLVTGEAYHKLSEVSPGQKQQQGKS